MRAESDRTKGHGRREEDEKIPVWKPRKGITYEKEELSSERWKVVGGMYLCSCSCKLCLSEAQYWEGQRLAAEGRRVRSCLEKRWVKA